MLTERQHQLLTAFVDGEMSEAQRGQVLALVAESSEARRLLANLERDASILRGLTTPPMNLDLSGPILEVIGRRPLAALAHRRTMLFRPAAFPVWTGLASAAAVLLLLGGVSYFYFAAAFPSDRDAGNLANNAAPEKPVLKPGSSPIAKNPDPKVSPEENQNREVAPLPERSPTKAALVENGPEPGMGPEKAPVPPDVFVAPEMEMFELRMVELEPPTVLRLRELDQGPVEARLLLELTKDNLFRLELPCRHASRAFERIQAVAKDHQLSLQIDSFAQGRLKMPQLRTHYAMFVEDLMPADAVRLVQQISAEDRKASQKRPSDAHFNHLVVGKWGKAERKDLIDLLGFDPAQNPSSRSLGPLGIDPSRPLSELTAAQVADKLTGQGGSLGNKGNNPSDRNVLVLALNPSRPRTTSLEVKRFQDARKIARPGSIQMLLVLRSTGF